MIHSEHVSKRRNYLTTSVDDTVYDRVQSIAKADSRTPSNVVLICVEKYLPILEKHLELRESPEEFKPGDLSQAAKDPEDDRPPRPTKR